MVADQMRRHAGDPSTNAVGGKRFIWAQGGGVAVEQGPHKPGLRN